MNFPLLLSIAGGGFAVAFFHAAIPTHWLPFVLTARVQGWNRTRTLTITALAGGGHVLFTTLLGVLIIALGMEVSRWTGQIFPWIAGGVLFAFGAFFLVRQAMGSGHSHLFGGHAHAHHDDHDHHNHDDHHDHTHHGHDHAPHHHDHPHAPVVPGLTEPHHFNPPRTRVSDRTAIISLLTLLTFSPCEGFLPVYVSAIQYGWGGFAVLSLVLALATLAGMLLFTSLTLAGLDRLNLKLLERNESAILGTVLCLLGVLIVIVEG
jgi:ABC-type nickel/cobalt efflux system permease component RcnA